MAAVDWIGDLGEESGYAHVRSVFTVRGCRDVGVNEWLGKCMQAKYTITE
jgi:hypothetical protein